MKLKLLSLILGLFLISCKEDLDNDLDSDVIKVSLDGTELYQYKIADAVPIEGGYEIRKQAENYQISEMDWGEYQYQAKEGFKGLEIVEIVLTGSSGDDNFTDYQKWIFEIEVK